MSNQYYQDNDDDLEEFDEDNSFEGVNEIFELRSQVHSLKIEKQKLILEHQAAINSIESRNQQLTQMNNQLRRDNNGLTSRLASSEDDYEDLKRTYETLKHQFQSMNRKTADFHRSSNGDPRALGDPSDLINDLLQKDKVIGELTNQLETYKIQQANDQKQQKMAGLGEEEREKLQSEIKGLKQNIDELKRKQIVYKREYEGMLQSKEEIIKKMSTQNEDYSRRITESKDKIINELKKQLQESTQKNNKAKGEIKALNEQVVAAESENTRIKSEFKRKEEKLLQSCEVEKQDLSKGMNEKLKKYLKQKEQKLSKAEDKIYELENQILLFKQEAGKQKAEISSLEQLTNYLETSNKQYEESKKKLQNLLYERQKQLGELRKTYFAEISDLKRTIIQERATMQQKISLLDEDLIHYKMQVEKLQEEKRQIQLSEEDDRKKHHSLNSRECQKLRSEKDDLNQELISLQQRYKEKSQKLLSQQKRIRKQYEERINGLESELIKERQRMRGEKHDFLLQKQDKKANYEEEYERLRNVVEMSEMTKNETEGEAKKLKEQKFKLQRQKMQLQEKGRDLQKRLKEKGEDYKKLQILYDELCEKHKKGTQDLQQQIQTMAKEIQDERRRADRKKNEHQESETSLSMQVKNYKGRIKELEDELDEYRTKKIEDAQYTDLKLQKMASELAVITKQKENAIKMNERLNKQKEEIYETEKQKLMEYIEQLEENNAILNRKLDMNDNLEKKNQQNIEKQLRGVKLQYSDALKETNVLLQKYKKLQEIHQEAISQMDCVKADFDNLNKKYLQIYREKNKLSDQLNSAYDQVNKLNMVLMSKEEQISRSKTMHCPHFEPKVQNFGYSNLDHHQGRNMHQNRSPLERSERSFMYRPDRSRMN